MQRSFLISTFQILIFAGFSFSYIKQPFNAVKTKVPITLNRLFLSKTIWGQNIIRCRPISVNSQKKFRYLGSYHADIPTFSLPEVVFLGRSNVGKSSLLNSLTGRNKNIAIVSKTPGCTKTINMYECSDDDGPKCIFVDLPGYGISPNTNL